MADAAEPLKSDGAALMRPNRALLALAATLFALAGPVVWIVASTGVVPLGILLVHCGLFGSMSLTYALNSPKYARFQPGTLAFDGTTLSLSGDALARRDELGQGFVVPWFDSEAGAAKTLLRFDRKGPRPPLYVQVKDEDEAHRILDAMGFDAMHRAAKMRIATGLLAMPLLKQLGLVLAPMVLVLPAIVATAMALGPTSGPLVLAMVAMLMAYIFTMAFVPMNVSIGTDGLVTSWFGKKRYIAFSELERVERYDEFLNGKQQRGVRLYLRGGEKVLLPTGQTDVGATESARLAARIEEARQARSAGADHPADLLVRGELALLEWVRELRRIGAGAHSPRRPAVPPDTLLGVVEDSKAPAVERANAAIAALASDDPEVHRRVRVAAETTASPKLRVALDRIVESPADEEEAAEALEALEALERENSV